MKLVSFSVAGGELRPGYLLEATNEIVDLTSSGVASTLDVIAGGAVSAASGEKLPLSSVRLHAPLNDPPRIFCIGLNYRDHAIESGMEIPKFPVVFFKMAPSIYRSRRCHRPALDYERAGLRS